MLKNGLKWAFLFNLFFSTLFSIDQYEPNDSTDTAYGPLFTGTTYQAYIHPGGDEDYYWFIHRSSLTMIRVYMRPPLYLYDYDLYLLNAFGVVVATSNRGAPYEEPLPEEIYYLPTSTEAEVGRFYVKILATGRRPEVYSDTEPYYFWVDYAGGAVSGKVYNAHTGLPIANALVEAYEEGKFVKSAFTDSSGRYTLVLKESTYTITASASGYIQESSHTFIVTIGAEHVLNFHLMEYSPDRIVSLTMPDAVIVQLFHTNAFVDVRKVIEETGGKDIYGFAVWQSSISKYYIPFGASNEDPPPDLTVKFTLTREGDFYIGVTTSPTGLNSDPLSVLTYGGLGYYGMLSQGLNERQNFLAYIAKEEWKKLKYKGHIIAGPESEGEFLNLSACGILNRYKRPIFVVFSAVAHAQEKDTSFSRLIHPMFSPATPDGGAFSLERDFNLVYLTTHYSYLTLTCFSSGEENISSSTIISATISQTGVGRSIRRLFNVYPEKISLYCRPVKRKVFSSFCGAFVADSVAVANWQEKANDQINPPNSFDKNPKPLVLKLETGWNYPSSIGKISGKVYYGDGSLLSGGIKTELFEGKNLKARTLTGTHGSYAITTAGGTYDLLLSSYPQYADKKLKGVNVVGSGFTTCDTILNKLFPVPTQYKILFEDISGDLSKYITTGTIYSDTNLLRFENDGYYHSIAMTTFTFTRSKGDLIFEIDFKTLGYDGKCGFGWGEMEGVGGATFADIKYGVIIEKSIRTFILSGEPVISEEFNVAVSTSYKVIIKKAGGGEVQSTRDGRKISYGIESIIDNHRFLIFSSTTSFADNIRVAQIEELEVSTGIIAGKITKSDGVTPLWGSTITIRHSLLQKTASTSPAKWTGRYSITFDTGSCVIEVSSVVVDGRLYLSQTAQVEVLPRQEIILNFALSDVLLKPDLMIESLTPSTMFPMMNEVVNVAIVVKNKGNANAMDFYVDFYKNLPSPPLISQAGDVYWLIGSLPAGKSVTLNWDFVYTGGILNLYAQVDTAGKVNEENEINNVFGPVSIGRAVLTAKLSGKVTSKEDKNPINKANVKVESDTREIITLITDVLGNYAVELETGAYRIVVTAENFVSTHTTVNLESDKVVNFELRYAPPYGTIFGYVRDENNLPIPVSSITFKTSAATIKSLCVQPDGFYRVFLLAGGYNVSASAKGYKSKDFSDVKVDSVTPTNLNIYLESIDGIPEPVKNFIAIPQQDLKIKLKWSKSPSENVTQYHLYYCEGELDYIKLYSAPKVMTSANECVIGPLTRGRIYHFSVRPITAGGIENNLTNCIISATPTDRPSGVKAFIKSPQTPIKATGEVLTVHAEMLWSFEKIEEVKFEYKRPYLAIWNTIPVVTNSINQNPDKKSPYFVHFDISSLEVGDYNLRAIAKGTTYDLTPLAFTITISTINYETKEVQNLKKQKVFNVLDSNIIISSFEEDKLTSIHIPEFSLPISTSIICIEILHQIDLMLDYFQPYKVRKVWISDSPYRKLDKKMRIEIPYEDNDLNGVIDNTFSLIEYLRICSLEGNRWVWERDFSILKDKSFVSINSDKLSIFAIFVPQEYEDLSRVVVYPNPFRGYDGHEKIKFKGLSTGVTLKIFDIAAEFVFEEEGINAFYEWDVKNIYGEKVASGVYIYLLKDKKGNIKKGKFVIIR